MNKAKILVVEDDLGLREALTDTLELAGYAVVTASNGEEGLAQMDRVNVDMVVSDVEMSPVDGHAFLEMIKTRRPQLPVIMMTAYGTIQKAVSAIRAGAADYLVKPFDSKRLVDLVGGFLTTDEIDADGVVCADPRSSALLELARRVAATDATVLIAGESGTGKEVVAQYIHRHSERSAGPFVALNCAAIPENMLEAMMFGYEKGAFTGASEARPGKFEQAQGGSLLLDEISEMDLGLQAKLLRVLQEREVERIGGRKKIRLDVRILATTNRDIRREVNEGRFREDLYYRLNVFPLTVPPLRQRPKDILPLARNFMKRATDQRVALSHEAEALLHNHSWPGNVRELDNVMQRALILKRGNMLRPQDIVIEQLLVPTELGGSAAREIQPEMAVERGEAGVLEQDLRTREEELILEALRAGNGSRKWAAEQLGISPRTLRYKLAKMREAGIPIPQ